jgi:WD40 repeat protein
LGVAIRADGLQAASASNDNTVRIWSLPAGECVSILSGHSEGATCVAFAPHGRHVISGSWDRTLRVWDLATGACLRVVEGHTHWVHTLAISSEGNVALSGSGDQTLKLWLLDWDYRFPTLADWDEGARPYLRHFITLHMPLRVEAFRHSQSWTEDEFQGLLNTVVSAGYGWLRPEGVRRTLEEATAAWQGPPPL